jgi:hypothetical protein
MSIVLFLLRYYIPEAVCKNKPNPAGIKNLVPATPNGLVLDFLVPKPGLMGNVHLPGIGRSVVKKLSEERVPNEHVFCDPYFASIPLSCK